MVPHFRRKTGICSVVFGKVLLFHKYWGFHSQDPVDFKKTFLPDDLGDIPRYWSRVKHGKWYGHVFCFADC